MESGWDALCLAGSARNRQPGPAGLEGRDGPGEPRVKTQIGQQSRDDQKCLQPGEREECLAAPRRTRISQAANPEISAHMARRQGDRGKAS